MEDKRILITGATGAFGKYLARQLLDTPLGVTFIIRAENDTQARKRLELTLGHKVEPRHTVLAGDLTDVQLGLKYNQYQELINTADWILHSAASTRFDLSLEEAIISNVTALENVIRLAEASKALSQFGYISTAFVAGKKTGLIPEEALDKQSGFVNTYDETKYIAETLVRSKVAQIPIAIYRPSLVVAPDSSEHHAAVVVLKLAKLGLLPILPGESYDLVDLISAKEASQAIAGLFVSHFEQGMTYNITNGDKAPSLGSIVSLAETSVHYSGHNPKDYDAAVANLIGQHPETSQLYAKIDCFIRYLLYPKQFANQRVTAALGSLGNESPVEILRQRLA